jgi:hypothetical protein
MTRGLTIETSAILDRVGDADHRGQRRPFDLNGLHRIAGLIERLRHDKGNGVTDVPHLAVREDRIGRASERILRQIEQARKIAEIADIVRREDRTDARQAAGAAGIDSEFRVRMRRAQHQRVHRRRRRVVIGVAALTANERIVFLAKDALTDAKFDGSHRISGSK